MLIGASAILLALGILAYRKTLAGQGRSAGDRGRIAEGVGLLALRVAVLLLFAAIFVGAVLTRVWTARSKRVAVLLDVSESMSAVKAESTAEAAAGDIRLPSGAVRQMWVFGDTALPQVKGQASKAKGQNGERTKVGSALAAVGKTRPGAVVLLSDGQDNGEADAAEAARAIGVPVHVIGFGGLARQNLCVEQVTLPAVVYAGETVAVTVRVGSALSGEVRGPESGARSQVRARIRLRGQEKELLLGAGTAEQDVSFKLVFEQPGRQVIEARADSIPDEANYADNVRSAAADVRPGRVRVVYVTNRPGPGTRMVLNALASDERLQVVPVVAVTGSIENRGQSLGVAQGPAKGESPVFPDVFILDNVVEMGSSETWQEIGEAVLAGAGVVILAGPDFRPGSGIRRLLPGSLEQAQVGSSTPQLTSEGRILPWFDESVIDLAGLPPFTGVRATSLTGTRHEVWLVAQENQTPLMVAARAGKGRVVYVAGYPLWRWGFGSRVNPPLRTALATFLSGVVRYLAERDTSPFRLSTDKPAYFRGEPVRLTLHAVGPDGRPWSKLSAVVAVRPAWDTGPAKGQSPVFETVPVLPMTETGDGVYQAVCEALEHGAYNATASVSRGDSLLGRASLSFAVAEQSIELARTGMDGGLLRAIAGASGGWFYPSESLPHEGVEIALGSYQRRFVFDPRRAVLAYVVVALLAGAEWFLRRRKGLL